MRDQDRITFLGTRMLKRNKELRNEISDLKKTLLRLIGCLAVELGTETAKSLISEINIHEDDT